MKRAMLSMLIACGVALPTSVRAFSDPVAFTDGVDLGGGGGRFFTGSATDGYGCGVCHVGGVEPTLAIKGLPLGGYAPSTAYEIQVDWPDGLEHIGLALEITDAAGHAAGTLRLPPASELPNEERCEPVEDGLIAAMLTELPEAGRSVINVPDCGAKRLRFLWTSPVTAGASLRFSGGLVNADGEADSAGDGSTQFAHTLPGVRTGALASEINGSCSASTARSPAPRLSWLVASALALLGYRRRRRA